MSFVCPQCQKDCKNKGGLTSHLKYCKPAVPQANAPSFEEIIDEVKLRKIVHHWPQLVESGAIKLRSYVWDPLEATTHSLKACKEGKVTIRYKKGSTSEDYGRWFAIGGGLQKMPRQVRHTIAGELYRDFDMKNAHPVLLLQYCEKKGIAASLLKRYVAHREIMLGEIMKAATCSKDVAKQHILALTNGGAGDLKDKKLPMWVNDYRTELRRIHKDVVERNPHFLELVKKKGKDFNIEGSTVNMLLCELENQVLEAILDYARFRGYAKGNEVLVFDGLMLLRSAIPEEAIPDFLKGAADHAFEKTGYRVVLEEKPMDEIIPLDNLPEAPSPEPLPFQELAIADLSEHDEMAKIAAQMSEGRIAFDGDLAYVFVPSRHMWVEDASLVHIQNYLLNVVAPAVQQAADQYKEAMKNSSDDCLKEKEAKLRLHVKALKDSRHVPRVIQMMKRHLQQEHFRSKLDTNPYLLAFDNGIFNLEEMKLEEGRPDHMVSLSTGYAFPSEGPDAEAAEYVQSFLSQLFGTEDELAYLEDILASCLDGTRRFEEFYILQGRGRNGKGTLMTLVQRVFGHYFGDLAAEFWTRPRKDSSSPMPELANKVGRRICNSSEPEAGDSPLQASKLKMFSGRDPVSCRELYGKDFSYTPQFGIFIQTNDIPNLNKVDQGVSNRLRIIQFPHQFVADPVLPHHRAQDPSIKERFQRDIQVRNALLWRLLGRYQEVRRKDKIIMPPRFKDVCKDFLDSSNPVIEFLQENYEITNNFEDVIPAHVLWASFQRNVKNYTQTMFGRLMEDAGISKSVKKIGEKAVRVYRGLRYQSNDEDSDHE